MNSNCKAAAGGVLLATALLASGCSSEESGASSSSPSASGSAGQPSGDAGAGGGAGGAGGQLQTFTAVDLDTDGANASDANTADVVTAVNAFLGTLSSDLTAAATFEFTDNQSRQTWSNFPASTVARKGVPLTDLDDAQKAAALAVVETMLSEQGYAQVLAVQASDDWLSANSSGGGSDFGSGNYYLAVYGTPSLTEPFQVQFGGHHLARNFTYDADTVEHHPRLHRHRAEGV